MIITIGGNIVEEIVKNSFSYNDKVNERTTCSFTVPDPNFIIDIGMEVMIEVEGDTIFGGTVNGVEEFGDISKEVLVSCVDFSQIIDKRIVFDTFEDEFAGNMVKAFISQFFHEEGVTEGNIQDGPEIYKAVFNYDNGNIAMNRISDLTTFNWEINHQKQLNFYERATYTAPFSLTDNSNNYYNFRVKRNRGQYRNRQYLRAGNDITIPQELRKPTPKPDGVSRQFFMRFPIAERPLIYINSVQVDPSDIGVNGLDRDKKWYFSYASNMLTHDENEPVLELEDVLEVTYRGLYPIIVVAEDVAQIGERQMLEGGSGVYESVAEEPNINEREAAFEYVFAKIEKYGLIPRVITFNTGSNGLKGGQLLTIINSMYGIDGSFLIESVSGRWVSGRMVYTVKALDGSALGGWEQFFKNLIQGQKRLVIRENEVLVLLTSMAERQGWAEQINIIPPLQSQETQAWQEDMQFTAYQCPFPSEELYPDENLFPC